MARRKYLRAIAGLVLWTATAGVPATAQEPTPETLIRSMTDTLASAQSISMHVEKMFDVVLTDGIKVQYSGAIDIDLRRPDRLYVSYGDDLSAKEVWYNGHEFVLHDHIENVYGSLPAADTIDATLDSIREGYGVLLPLAELLSSDAHDAYADQVLDAGYVGLHDVGGKPAHHLIFTGPNAVWQVWIDAGDVPLPLKLVVAQPDADGYPQHIFIFTEWDLAAELSDEDFEPEVPEGATIANFLPRED